MTNPRPLKWSMRLSDWPTPDRRLWLSALEPRDIFDKADSPAEDWSAASRTMIEEAYGRWLIWLAAHGMLDQTANPGDRVSSEVFSRFVIEIRAQLTPMTVTIIVGRIKRMMNVLAPNADWRWMSTLNRNLKRTAVPTRQKHAKIVEAAALYKLGTDLCRAADELPADHYRAPQLARDGLLIALLAARPIRLSNLTSIEIGKHLIRDAELYRLIFAPEETKVGRPIDLYCPADLTPFITEYIEVYRPRLIARAKDRLVTCRLWINRLGRVMDLTAIHYQIKLRTRVAFGHPINPHLFRDCAATSIAVHDPEHVRIATVILGHTRTSTTDKHYNQAQMLSASRLYHREIIGLRNKARSWRSRKPPRT